MIEPRPSQWEVVKACDEHVLVEAGAGTGKTATVVARILYLLGAEVCGSVRPDPVTLADIVAITFTRQAAADLKRDLRSALRERGRLAAARQVDLARIGTIHGFCSDLVREHALRAGRTPVGDVLEEGEGLAWAEGCVRDELLLALETPGSMPGLPALLAQWETKKIEPWVMRLMRAPELLAAADFADHTPEENALLELARRAAARLEQRLADEGKIDFDRMIAWTRDLLRDQPGVRARLQRRIHTLIIDEFQDTDPLQQEIAYLLAEPLGRRGDTPRLMLVGDPKQSIYRFRGADVTVWSHVLHDFETTSCGRVLPLQDNFRSVPAILSFVEASVAQWLDSPVDGRALRDYEVRFAAVDPTRPEPDEPAVEFLLVPADSGTGKARKAEDRRALEAAGIAARLLELHAGGAGVQWKDMALLLRTWSALDVYRSALDAAGIPVYALRDDDFLETREVLDLVLALDAIRDPRDDRAVIGFLRSPFVSLRDDTLLAIALGTKQPYTRNIVPRAVPESERVAFGLDLLRELAQLRDRIPASALLSELLFRTGYLGHLSLLGDRGGQAALNVRRFLQLLDGMEDMSTGEVLRALAERRERKDRMPQARLYGEQDDVVLVTSVHMAKGLDWRVVVYGDLARGENQDHDRLQIGRNSIRLGEPDLKGEEQDPRWQALRAELALESEAEEKRVAYVAMTRARDRLILSGIPQGSGKKGSADPLLALFPALEKAADHSRIAFEGRKGDQHTAIVRVVSAPSAVIAVPRRISPPGAAEIPVSQALPPGNATPPGLLRHSATELLAYARCERRHQLRYVLGIREPEVRGKGGQVLGGAIARGQIVHDVLERWREELDLALLLEDAIGRWDTDAPPPDSTPGVQYRAELGEEITRVLALSEYAAVANAEGARRELRFLHVLPNGEALQGAFDLAAPLPEGISLLDVKTSRIEASAAAKKAAEYEAQRDVYVSVADALCDAPVREFAFVFSGPGVSSTSRLTAADAAAYRARVAATLERMGTAAANVASNPRECFFCGYRGVDLCPGVQPDAGQSIP